MKYVLIIFFCSCLAAPCLALAADANDASEPAFLGFGAIDLLAGDVLDAWTVPSDRWSLNGGSIVGHTGGEKIKIPEWIYTKQRFGDFVFSCELKLSGDDSRNTGIYYRVNTFPVKNKRGTTAYDAPSGYEFDAAYHQPGKKNYRGTLGDWYARPSLRIFPDQRIINQAYQTDEWNRMTLRARGNRLEYWINGIKVVDFHDPDPKASREGIIGFQIHNGSVMKVEYRNIRVRSLES